MNIPSYILLNKFDINDNGFALKPYKLANSIEDFVDETNENQHYIYDDKYYTYNPNSENDNKWESEDLINTIETQQDNETIIKQVYYINEETGNINEWSNTNNRLEFVCNTLDILILKDTMGDLTDLITKKTIDDSSIGTVQLQDNAITTNKILDNAVTMDKIDWNNLTEVTDNFNLYLNTGIYKVKGSQSSYPQNNPSGINDNGFLFVTKVVSTQALDLVFQILNVTQGNNYYKTFERSLLVERTNNTTNITQGEWQQLSGFNSIDTNYIKNEAITKDKLHTNLKNELNQKLTLDNNGIVPIESLPVDIVIEKNGIVNDEQYIINNSPVSIVNNKIYIDKNSKLIYMGVNGSLVPIGQNLTIGTDEGQVYSGVAGNNLLNSVNTLIGRVDAHATQIGMKVNKETYNRAIQTINNSQALTAEAVNKLNDGKISKIYAKEYDKMCILSDSDKGIIQDFKIMAEPKIVNISTEEHEEETTIITNLMTSVNDISIYKSHNLIETYSLTIRPNVEITLDLTAIPNLNNNFHRYLFFNFTYGIGRDTLFQYQFQKENNNKTDLITLETGTRNVAIKVPDDAVKIIFLNSGENTYSYTIQKICLTILDSTETIPNTFYVPYEEEILIPLKQQNIQLYGFKINNYDSNQDYIDQNGNIHRQIGHFPNDNDVFSNLYNVTLSTNNNAQPIVLDENNYSITLGIDIANKTNSPYQITSTDENKQGSGIFVNTPLTKNLFGTFKFPVMGNFWGQTISNPWMATHKLDYQLYDNCFRLRANAGSGKIQGRLIIYYNLLDNNENNLTIINQLKSWIQQNPFDENNWEAQYTAQQNMTSTTKTQFNTLIQKYLLFMVNRGWNYYFPCNDVLDSNVQLPIAIKNQIKNINTFYPQTYILTTNFSYNDSYSQNIEYSFNYPVSLEAGYEKLKEIMDVTQDNIYDIDVLASLGYINSETALALTKLSSIT